MVEVTEREQVAEVGGAAVGPVLDVVSYKLLMWAHGGQGRYLRPHLGGSGWRHRRDWRHRVDS